MLPDAVLSGDTSQCIALPVYIYQVDHVWLGDYCCTLACSALIITALFFSRLILSRTDWLTIHARTKTQGYKPPAYWDKIQSFNALDIPVIANGEIWSAAQANDCMMQAGTSHLMLGRGAVTRPDLVAQVDNVTKNSTESGENTATLLWQDLIAHQIKFLEGEAKNDVVLVGRYKQWLGMLTKGYAEAQTVWEGIKREKNKAVIINALQASVQQ